MRKEIRSLVGGSLLVVFVVAMGCNKQPAATGQGNASEEESQGGLEGRIDKHGEEILASSAKSEARQWMKQTSHVFFKGDPKQIAEFVEQFYGAGAPQVLIGDIEEHDGKQYGGSLLVVLPGDKSARAKLFEIGTRAGASFQEDPVSDKGQKYLYYSFD